MTYKYGGWGEALVHVGTVSFCLLVVDDRLINRFLGKKVRPLRGNTFSLHYILIREITFAKQYKKING